MRTKTTSNSHSQSGRKIGRQKELNIIYFVDASSTRSLRIPINYAIAILSVSIAVVMWAIGSAGIIYSFYADARHKEQRINGLSAAVFDYQTRFDGVYESAYPQQVPEQPTQPLVAKEDVKPDIKKDAEQPVLALAAKAIEPVPQPVVAVESDAQTPTAAVPASLKAVEIDLPTVKIQHVPGHLSLDMDIKNKAPEALASGYVYAVVKLQSEGTTKYVANPRSLSLTDAGIAKNAKRAISFTIRRFKPVQMEFAVPAVDPGTPVTVTAYIAGGNNELYSFELPPHQLTTAGNEPVQTAPVDSQPASAHLRGSEEDAQ